MLKKKKKKKMSLRSNSHSRLSNPRWATIPLPQIIVPPHNGTTSCMTSLRSRRISSSQDTKDHRGGRENLGGGIEHVRDL